MTNKEKFLALVSKEETKTVERARERLAINKIAKICIKYNYLEIDIDKLNKKINIINKPL